MVNLIQELRWAVRKMRRNPVLSAVIVLSLGLSIGAVTAVYSVVDAFLVRPLAIDDIDRVVRLREDYSAPGEEPDLRSVKAVNYYLWKEAAGDIFSGMGAGTGVDLTWTGGAEPERVSAAAVTASFFPVLGIEPVIGRTFTQEEDRPGSGGGVVLISYRIWATRFAASRDVLGRTLTLNGQPRTVIGVMPRGLHHPYEADMWIPLQLVDDPTNYWGYYVPARLAPGVTLEQARSAMDRLVGNLREGHPYARPPRTANLSPLRGELIADLDQLLYMLLAAASFVLLIACANVANLLLARSLGESGEMAIQTALGAGRWRLVRQSLLFSLVLALLAGVVGILTTAWSIDPLVALSPVYGLGEFDIQPRMDWSTLGFTILLSCAVGLLFGLVPALRTRPKSLQTDLQEGGRSGGASRKTQRALKGFVVAQIALAVALLVAAALNYQSLRYLVDQDRGFDMDHVLSFEVAFPEARYPERAQRVEFVRRAVERLGRLAGVEAVGATTTQPLYPGTWASRFNIEGRPPNTERGYHLLHSRTVTPGYLASLRVPLLEGRMLDDHDGPDSPPVVLVSRSLAERYWPGESAIGKRIKRGLYESDVPWMTIVGVVGTLQETEDAVLVNSDAWYLPYTQDVGPLFDSMVFTLRTEGSMQGLVPAIRREIEAIDPDQPIYDVKSMRERLRERTTPQRFTAVLYAGLGTLGLILAALGIYGVLSYSVAQRVRELGVRAALGAAPRELERVVLRQAAVLVVSGVGLGLALALVASRFLEGQLEGVGARDPATLAFAVVTLTVLSLGLSWIPAHRASRVDVAGALRQE